MRNADAKINQNPINTRNVDCVQGIHVNSVKSDVISLSGVKNKPEYLPGDMVFDSVNDKLYFYTEGGAKEIGDSAGNVWKIGGIEDFKDPKIGTLDDEDVVIIRDDEVKFVVGNSENFSFTSLVAPDLTVYGSAYLAQSPGYGAMYLGMRYADIEHAGIEVDAPPDDYIRLFNKYGSIKLDCEDPTKFIVYNGILSSGGAGALCLPNNTPTVHLDGNLFFSRPSYCMKFFDSDKYCEVGSTLNSGVMGRIAIGTIKIIASEGTQVITMDTYDGFSTTITGHPTYTHAYGVTFNARHALGVRTHSLSVTNSDNDETILQAKVIGGSTISSVAVTYIRLYSGSGVPITYLADGLYKIFITAIYV